MNPKDPHRYDAYLNVPRHVSAKHPPMDPIMRASIFSPFAALTGYEGQIKDAQHHRCNRTFLSEEEKEPINAVLANLKKYDRIDVTYFVYNPGTDGAGHYAEGEYVNICGDVIQFDATFKTLRVAVGESWRDVGFEDIISIKRM